MLECEAAFENMQSRKSQLQEELTGLKKQFTRIASGGDLEQTKSQLQGEVSETLTSFPINCTKFMKIYIQWNRVNQKISISSI